MTQQLQSSVAFLPVNPNLSPLRNQGRQKLARLNSEDFAQLVVHILLDTKRRQQLSIETGELQCVLGPVLNNMTQCKRRKDRMDFYPSVALRRPHIARLRHIILNRGLVVM